MHQKKHICGYPIWVENEEKAERWITRFWDAPDGNRTTRCPGCGGRLVPWEVTAPQPPPPDDAQLLGAALASLVEKVEALLYAQAPDQATRWAALTQQARSALGDAGIDVTPPPWAS